jgi:PGF-CTERM protein
MKPDVGRDIEVRIMPNQTGDDFQVQGRIVYYFGDDPAEREDHTLTLSITVRAGPGVDQTQSPAESKESSTPGFAAVVAIIGLLAIYLRRKRR